MLSNIQHWNQEGFWEITQLLQGGAKNVRVGAICLCPHCQIGYRSDQLPFLGSCISESELLHPETHNWCFCIMILTAKSVQCPLPCVTFSLKVSEGHQGRSIRTPLPTSRNSLRQRLTRHYRIMTELKNHSHITSLLFSEYMVPL